MYPRARWVYCSDSPASCIPPPPRLGMHAFSWFSPLSVPNLSASAPVHPPTSFHAADSHHHASRTAPPCPCPSSYCFLLTPLLASRFLPGRCALVVRLQPLGQPRDTRTRSSDSQRKRYSPKLNLASQEIHTHSPLLLYLYGCMLPSSLLVRPPRQKWREHRQGVVRRASE